MTDTITLRTRQLYQKIVRVLGALNSAPKVPLFIIFTMIVISIFANLIAPHSPVQGSLSNSLLPPAWMDGGNSSYLLGTDKFGRDVLSRLLYGARVSTGVAVLAISVTVAFGAAIGLIAGYFGRSVDTVLMRLADIGLSFPGILIALVLAVTLGPSFTNVIIIVLIVLWPRFARQVRGETLSIKEMDYVIMARTMGVSHRKIIWRHLLPNVIPSLLVLSTFEVGGVVILESTLAFLGVGIPPPNPSWGVMIAEGREYLDRAWWISVFPGVAIALTVFSINMIGDWVRDKLDPKLRQI